MMNLIVSTDKAVRLLQGGKVGIMATDTVYGIVCLASDEAAVNRLYKIKHREHKPGTIIAANSQQLIDLGVKARYIRAVEQFWPGAVSVKIPLDPKLEYLQQGVGDGAFRVVADETVRATLEQTGPLNTTSANMPGEPTARNIKEAMDCFGDTVDFYVDGGNLTDRPPSTVIRIIDDAIEVVREGAVKISDSGRIITN